MLRGFTRRSLARRKTGGQRPWTPASQASGASPSVGVSGMEALTMVYRPLPLDQTVEYEEDFGPSMFIQREFVAKRAREGLAFDVAPLVYSDVELQKGKAQLANQLNKERAGSAAASANVPFETNVDPDTREVVSARYLFDDARMEFCRRFEEALGDGHGLFSLMEACAVVFGCPDDASKEAYLKQFLRLDRQSLEDDTEMVRALHADLEDANKMISSGGSDTTGDDGLLIPEEDDGALAEHIGALPDEYLEYAPMVKSYLAHARGERATVSTDVSSLGSQGAVAERHRWRKLMEKVVAEDYHKLTPLERADAVVLSEQLNSVKFFDLRLGDVVREIVHIGRRSTGTGGSQHSAALEASATHPERRSSTDGV